MKRSTFLFVASVIALLVGTLALFFPIILLESKGVAGLPATQVWMQETGALLLALGLTAFAIRKHADSPTLGVFLWGNAFVQVALLAIEVVAYAQGTIPLLLGILPNSALHLILGTGFVLFARQVSLRTSAGTSPGTDAGTSTGAK